MQNRHIDYQERAIQWTGLNLEEVKRFVGDSLNCNICDAAWQAGKGTPYVWMEVSGQEIDKGDYIVKSADGEYYTCKPDSFAQNNTLGV